MKIFLSWSGKQSKHIASLLKDWIPDVLQEVQPWMSEHDIKAGSRWSKELGEQLSVCDFGILTITQQNQSAPWLLFEAGSLAKTFDEARVIPYLIGLKPTDLEFPLAQFQSVEVTKEGTLKLIQALNSVLKKPVSSEEPGSGLTFEYSS